MGQSPVKCANTMEMTEKAKKIINEQMFYDKDLTARLLIACENVYIEKKQEDENKILVVYKDDNYPIPWILDLTKFKHPLGIGPNIRSFKRKDKYCDITTEFNSRSHSNSDYNTLLHYVVGIYGKTHD